MTKPWPSRAILFAASNAEVSGDKLMKSFSTISLAYKTIGSLASRYDRNLPAGRYQLILSLHSRLHKPSTPQTTRQYRRKTCNPHDNEYFMNRIHERTNIHRLTTWQACEYRLQHRQGHTRSHNRKANTQTQQNPSTHQCRTHSTSNTPPSRRNTVHYRGNIWRHKHPAANTGQDHRNQQLRIRRGHGDRCKP